MVVYRAVELVQMEWLFAIHQEIMATERQQGITFLGNACLWGNFCAGGGTCLEVVGRKELMSG